MHGNNIARRTCRIMRHLMAEELFLSEPPLASETGPRSKSALSEFLGRVNAGTTLPGKHLLPFEALSSLNKGTRAMSLDCDLRCGICEGLPIQKSKVTV